MTPFELRDIPTEVLKIRLQQLEVLSGPVELWIANCLKQEIERRENEQE